MTCRDGVSGDSNYVTFRLIGLFKQVYEAGQMDDFVRLLLRDFNESFLRSNTDMPM